MRRWIICAPSTRRSFVDGLLPDQYAAAPATPQDILQARQGLTGVDAALAALPERTRHVFLLNRIHGRTFAEIAAVMEISERMVAKHMAAPWLPARAALLPGERTRKER
ncbi:sigma factor-like helix-turn-helix DNA-binding protein [Pannonibacter sp. Pt2-lr]